MDFIDDVLEMNTMKYDFDKFVDDFIDFSKTIDLSDKKICQIKLFEYLKEYFEPFKDDFRFDLKNHWEFGNNIIADIKESNKYDNKYIDSFYLSYLRRISFSIDFTVDKDSIKKMILNSELIADDFRN